MNWGFAAILQLAVIKGLFLIFKQHMLLAMKSLLRVAFVIFVTIIPFWSCKETPPSSDHLVKSTNQVDRFEVSLEDAAKVARYDTAKENQSKQSTSSRTLGLEDEIVEQLTIRDSSHHKPLFYIFKKRMGFTIVAADFRVMPVLAYSEKSTVDLKKIPNGVRLWMNMAAVKIKEARNDAESSDPIVLKEWDRYLSNGLRTTDSNCIEWYQYGQFMCKGTVIQRGPLLTTNWSQTHLSTTQLSVGGNCDGCGRRLAGCGPVAMAQVVEYYHPDPARPRDSDGNCQANTVGEINLGTLMYNMGSHANAMYNYLGTCNTFTWPSNVKSGLKNYGFSNGGSGNEAYNYNLIKSELNGNHPMIFWGSTCLDCFNDYHIWVCDGYKENNYSDFNCTTKHCNTWSFSYLHMNWGWESEAWNDYYAFGQYNVNGSNYDGNLHVITGIRP
jgi:hypothetical protein